MGAVAVAVTVIPVNGVGTPSDTAAEFGVVDVDSGVDTVDGDSCTGGVVVDEVTAAGGSVGDSS